MKRRALFVILGAALLIALAGAGSASAQPKTLQFLGATDVDPVRLLPAPPADGSPANQAELAELRRIATETAPERWDQAKWDADNENGTIFQSAIAPGFDLSALPVTAHLLADVRNEEAIAASKAKDYFKRDRPWVLDDSLKTCDRQDAPQSSYPSGHATMAFAMAVVLAQAMPDNAAQIMNRARDYAESRLICAAHWRSDIVGGQALGTAVGSELLQNAKFHQELVAAEQELQAAHLTAPTN
ncbi:MAG TPA: phosphatase PAP2 family protein [Caulobacteraceae bacterium]|nr:phosphatase PAP2 family protein [Caulobacteraceae bacterium]